LYNSNSLLMLLEDLSKPVIRKKESVVYFDVCITRIEVPETLINVGYLFPFKLMTSKLKVEGVEVLKNGS
jgi:hypothetical protein